MTRVAITGVGVIAPKAVGVDGLRELLNSQQTAIEPVSRFDTTGLRAQKAALVGDFNSRPFIAPMKARRMNTLSRWAVSASKMAIGDAVDPVSGGCTGVALGTAFGPVQTSVEYMHEYVEKGASLAPPQLFAESVANAPGSHIAIEHAFRGFNVTVTQRESSALAAVMYAATQIVKGAADSAIAGGVEDINEMIYSVLDRIGALAHRNGATDEASRPFDRHRNGLVVGEGSVMFVLAAAAKRAYAYLSGFGIARDTTATISDWGSDPSALQAAMRNACEDAAIDPSEISAVYASANSTVRADDVEARAILDLLGGEVPVVATKGYWGEYAAGGALQIAAAALAISDQVLHASVGYEEGSALNIVSRMRPAKLTHVLVNSVSAGGGIVCAVLSREAA
jgi:3-oxoacyl-[acyl-carrier-protein] synthase II